MNQFLLQKQIGTHLPYFCQKSALALQIFLCEPFFWACRSLKFLCTPGLLKQSSFLCPACGRASSTMKRGVASWQSGASRFEKTCLTGREIDTLLRARKWIVFSFKIMHATWTNAFVARLQSSKWWFSRLYKTDLFPSCIFVASSFVRHSTNPLASDEIDSSLAALSLRLLKYVFAFVFNEGIFPRRNGVRKLTRSALEETNS